MKFFTACFLFLYLYMRIDGQLDCGNIQKDLLFIVDESNSISDDDFDNVLRPFLVELVGCYNLSADAIQMSLETFSYPSIERYGLDEFNDNVTGAQDFLMNFNRTDDNQSTRTYTALQSVRENIIGSPADRPSVGNCLVIITDGGSNAPGNTLYQRELIDPLVDEVFVIGIGSFINETELDALASRPLSSHKFLAANFGELQNFKDIFAAIPCPPCDPECLNGGFCDRPNQVCECTEDFTGDACETRIC